MSASSDWFDFRNGSSWTYYLLTDTTTEEKVDLQDFQRGFIPVDRGKSAEFFNYTLKSDRLPQLELIAMANPQDENDRLYWISYNNIDTPLNVPFINTPSSGFIANKGDSLYTLPQMRLGDRSYSDVMVFKPFSAGSFKAIYVARGIGIIRKDYRNGNVFFLKKYSLKR